MKFIDEAAKDELAKSSTTLQCILSILDYECNRFHMQLEVIGVTDNVALIDLDPLGNEEIMAVCMKANQQFQRRDGQFTCYQKDYGKTFVK
jgi:hypothetical protein